jgi:hypothetical protein
MHDFLSTPNNRCISFSCLYFPSSMLFCQKIVLRTFWWMYNLVKWMNFTYIWWLYYGGMEMAFSGLD